MSETPTGTSYTDHAGVTISPKRRMALMKSLAPKITKGGIEIPDTATKVSDVGPHELEVLAHGPGSWEDGIWVPTNVKVGERVLLHGQRQTFGGEALLLTNKEGKSEKHYLIDEDFLCATIARAKVEKPLIVTPATDIQVPRIGPKGRARR